MAHDCPECGQLCYCDLEDAWSSYNANCTHWASEECVDDDFDYEPEEIGDEGEEEGQPEGA